MNSRQIKQFLHQLTTESLIDNQFSKVVTTYFDILDFSKKDKFYESLLPHYSSFREENFQAIHYDEVNEDMHPHDLRLKAIRLSNLRGITRIKGDVEYGIDFFEKSRFKNIILLGPNGTGKSSIYDALEYIYTNKIGELNLRSNDLNTIGQSEYIDFLGHFKNLPNCRIETASGEFNLSNPLNTQIKRLNPLFDPSILFINDYNIYAKCQKNYSGDETDENSFHYLIASTLGMQDYLSFNAFMKSFASYRRTTESKERSKLDAERSELESKVLSHIAELEQKQKDLNVVSSNKTDNTERQNQNLILLIEKLKYDRLGIVVSTRIEIRKSIELFAELYNNFIGLDLNQNLQEESEFLSLGLSLLFDEDNCPFCNESKLTKDEIKLKVEARIEKNKISSENISLLKYQMDRIQEYSVDLFEQANILKSKLVKQNETIVNQIEFESIYKINKEILDLLEIALIEKKQIFESDFKNIAQLPFKEGVYRFNGLITNNNSFFLIELLSIPEAVNEKIEVRRKRIEAIEDRILLTSKISNSLERKLSTENEIRLLRNAIAASNERIKSITTAINDLDNKIELFKKLRTEAMNLAEKVDLKVNQIVSEIIDPIKETIEDILFEYFKDEDVKIKIEFYEKTVSAEENIKSKYVIAKIHKIDIDTGEVLAEISPTKYFNTFRSRLFSSMIHLSLAIVSRKKFKINTPLIIDDIFYASDYSNKTSFNVFFRKLINIFKKFNHEMPLQFILLTHDDIIFDSALDAIDDLKFQKGDTREQIDWINELKENTKTLRLFPASDTDEKPKHSEFGDYWNLTVEIPFKIIAPSDGVINQN